ncbi:MAG TPA: DMT family transporter, partial [Longimicrobiales bacterium]|nr:DMT family transporter [Longimicrobiales bacterium]
TAPATPASEWATELGLGVLAVIWGVNFPLIKVALEDFPPLAFNALRFPLAAAVLLLLMKATGGVRWPEPRDRMKVIGLGILGNVVYQLLFIVGLSRTGAGNASLLLATTPAWTALLSTAVGHERLAGRVWLGIAGAVAGMVLVVAGGQGFHFGGGTLMGDVLMIVASMTWALYTVGGRPLIQRYGAMAVTGWTLWAGMPALVLLGVPALVRTDFSQVSAGSWGALVYAGVLAISVAYALWNRGVRRLGNARTAIYSNTVPVVALAAAWIGLGEVPTPLQLAGAAVILGGLTLARTGRGRLTGR